MADFILYQPTNSKKPCLTLALAPDNSGLMPDDEIIVQVHKGASGSIPVRASIVKVLTDITLKSAISDFILTYCGCSDIANVPEVSDKVLYNKLSNK